MDSSQCTPGSGKLRWNKVKNPLKFLQTAVQIQPDGLAPKHEQH